MRVIKPIILFFCFSCNVCFAWGQGKLKPRNSNDTLSIKFDSLKAAVVTAVIRPGMKGDTLEYNTERIKTPPHATVEELLGRLPGLQVDPDGTIAYNGERIQHLLVDGEDIFGDNPTMVTRNFEASKIVRVEILDRKSDQAIFTGLDDGARTKTLNLVVKETAKNGYFGKLQAAGNSDGNYAVNGTLAGFKDREQLTAFAIASNTGTSGFTGSDGGSSDPLGASAGTGIPQFVGTGLHYANSCHGSEDHVSGNYQFGQSSTQPITTILSLQTEADSIFRQTQQCQSLNHQDRHQFNGIYDWTISRRSGLQFTLHGDQAKADNKFGANGTSTFNDTLVNTSQRTIQDLVSQESFGGDIGWRTQIGKKEASIFSFISNTTTTHNSVNGYLYSLNQFFEPIGSLQSTDTVDQRKEIKDRSLDLSGTLNYTRPIWQDAIIGGSYEVSYTSGSSLLNTFGGIDGKYTEIIDSLSSTLKTHATSQFASLNLEGKTKRLQYNFDTKWLDYKYWQHDLIADSVFKLRYSSLSPDAMVNFTPNPALNFKFSYNASTQEPSASQLAPVKNNTNPLNIALGNPDLHPAFNQKFELGFRLLKTWNLDLNGSLTMANSAISTKTTTDSLGRQVSQPVNVSGGKTTMVNFGVNRIFLGINWGCHFDNTYTEMFNYINASLNRNDATTTDAGFAVSKYVEDKYSLYFRTNYSYFDSRNTINASAPLHYWTQNYNGAITIYFLRNLELHSDVVYAWQEKTNNLVGSKSVTMWKASIARNFFKNNLSIKFLFNNILNENMAITRTNSSNINSQSSTNILGRYWMLSAAYHFDKSFRKK